MSSIGVLGWGSGVREGRFSGDPPEGGVQGARGEQGTGGLGEQAAGEAAAGAHGDRGVDLGAPALGMGEAVVDVEGDRTARAELDAGLVGLVDLELEADAAAGEPAGDASA